MKIRKPPRRISSDPRSLSSAGISDTSAAIVASHARQIRDLPSYQKDVLLNAIREGIKPSAIAAFFLEQGWLTVSEKTFVQYIQAYKRTYPDEIQRDDDEKSLNHHVDPRQPALDEETVLEQLIRTQKNRIGIALKFEKDTSIPQQHLHKDINATADLVTKLAALRGRLAGPGRPTHEVHPLSGEAKDALRKVDQSEHKQEKIVGMIGRLGSLIAAKQNARADQG